MLFSGQMQVFSAKCLAVAILRYEADVCGL